MSEWRAIFIGVDGQRHEATVSAATAGDAETEVMKIAEEKNWGNWTDLSVTRVPEYPGSAYGKFWRKEEPERFE